MIRFSSKVWPYDQKGSVYAQIKNNMFEVLFVKLFVYLLHFLFSVVLRLILHEFLSFKFYTLTHDTDFNTFNASCLNTGWNLNDTT
jgi:hypothetical protein